MPGLINAGIVFVLSNYFLTFPVIGLLFSGANRLRANRKQDEQTHTQCGETCEMSMHAILLMSARFPLGAPQTAHRRATMVKGPLPRLRVYLMWLTGPRQNYFRS
jgi:hypothetical protein